MNCHPEIDDKTEPPLLIRKVSTLMGRTVCWCVCKEGVGGLITPMYGPFDSAGEAWTSLLIHAQYQSGAI